MKKLDHRGVAALEFSLVAAPLFVLMFAIFDLGTYAITAQSLRALANAGARAIMIKCYTPAVIANTSPQNCTDIDTYFPLTDREAAAPLLYPGGTQANGLALSVLPGAASLTVTASQPFTPVTPLIWGAALNTPNGSTSIPF
jgi:hypothetical protein